MELGRVYKLYPPLSNVQRHWYAVCSHETASGKFVCFNWTDDADYYDKTTQISLGEYPEIYKPSVVAYAWGAEFTAAAFQAAQRERQSFVCPDLSDRLLLKIQLGAFKSPYTPDKLLDAVQAALPHGVAPPPRPTVRIGKLTLERPTGRRK